MTAQRVYNAEHKGKGVFEYSTQGRFFFFFDNCTVVKAKASLTVSSC